jgi:flagellar biosynthesis GTPase FlhF
VRIKSFYADTMDGALQSASRELGDEALILNTRESPREFQHFGRYEVVCAVAHDEPVAASVAADLQPEKRRTPRTSKAQIVVLVGPSGSGKTTSCAKIAIQAKFNDKLNPAILCWDGGQVGGASALESYCGIAGLPFAAVSSAEEMVSALEETADHDLVLIDTPSLEGAAVGSDELIAALGELPQAEVHLVLSSTYSAAYLRSTYERYRRFAPQALLPTHLDEARMDLGAAGLESLRELTIRWCGTGRSVPEDMQDAQQVVRKAEAMARPEPPAAKPAPTPEARKTIDSILARFRSVGQESRAGSLHPSKSSAA